MASNSSILAWRIPWAEEPVTKSRTQLKQLSMCTQMVSVHQKFCLFELVK